MNTTALIDHWSMDGAGDLEGHFRSAVDIHAMLSEPTEASPDHTSLLVKGPEDEDWRPLVVGNAA